MHKDFEIKISLPGLASRIFGDKPSPPIEATEDVPELADANRQLARMKRGVVAERQYGSKGEDDLG